MTQLQVQEAFVVDGKIFASKAEANDYIRKPLIKAALMVLTGNNAELADWIIENREELDGAYVAGTVARVTKAERKELAKALKAVEGVAGAEFINTNAEAILTSFKWPTKPRVKPEEKEAAITAAFMDITDGNTELVNWLITNKAGLDAAFSAGITKREAPVGGQEALAQWRAERQAAKEAGPEALAEFDRQQKEKKAAKLAAEKAAKAAKKAD